MSYTNVYKQLNENLQLAYRQTIDADEKLKALKKQGHAKFKVIFKEDQGFKTQSDFFQPYIRELAEELSDLTISKDVKFEEVEALVNKLGILLQTLHQLKDSLK